MLRIALALCVLLTGCAAGPNAAVTPVAALRHKKFPGEYNGCAIDATVARAELNSWARLNHVEVESSILRIGYRKGKQRFAHAELAYALGVTLWTYDPQSASVQIPASVDRNNPLKVARYLIPEAESADYFHPEIP